VLFRSHGNTHTMRHVVYVVLIFATFTQAFVSRCHQIKKTSAYSCSSLFGNSNKNELEEQWELPNDFRTFLNQCSIQSFMFLLRQLRDMQTVLWMESFTQPSIVRSPSDDEALMSDGSFNTGAIVEEPSKPQAKLLQYHGLSAINTTLFPTWESYFKTMLLQEKESWTITSTQAYIPSYDWEVNPASLCARLISVREQIANEWVKDLSVIEKMGGLSIESYWEALKRHNASDERGPTIERPNLLFLDFDPNFGSDLAPSPLRKGNFDLLCLLTTQEAIHRILNDRQDQQDGNSLVANAFLQEFYQDRMHYFTGSQRYGRADDFLQDLLSETPRMISSKPGVTLFIDPIRVAESIMSAREQVAVEWRELARVSPTEHFTVRKMMLNKMMGIDIGLVDSQT